MNDLFDIAHQIALDKIKIEMDGLFLNKKKENWSYNFNFARK